MQNDNECVSVTGEAMTPALLGTCGFACNTRTLNVAVLIACSPFININQSLTSWKEKLSSSQIVKPGEQNLPRNQSFCLCPSPPDIPLTILSAKKSHSKKIWWTPFIPALYHLPKCTSFFHSPLQFLTIASLAVYKVKKEKKYSLDSFTSVCS